MPPGANEATSAPTTIPAPVGGWNARDPLANMNPLDCVVCTNIFPSTASVSLRPGSVAHKTGFASNVDSLMVYSSGTTSSLWAATTTGIYNATSAGAIGASALTTTNGRWHYANITTSGGSFLSAVNGVDKLALYNGTTWAYIDAASTPAITGVLTTALSNICLWKRRLWFVQKNTMNGWYLPVDSIGGAATQFNFGPIFSMGGYLVDMASWTLDGGTGSEDLFVIVTSEGELAVYQGTDPTATATFALVGVYYIGAPVGAKPFCKYGGDLLYLSEQGLVELSKLVKSSTIGKQEALSYKIDLAINQAADAYGANFGWEIVNYPSANLIFVNVPITTNTTSTQYAMNAITKSWCNFNGWNANCWAVFNSLLYYGGSDTVYQAWTGLDDVGVAITGEVQMAYNSFRIQGNKQVELVRPNILLSGSITLSLRFDTDFADGTTYSQAVIGVTTTASLWGTDLWDTGIWSEFSSVMQSRWLSVSNNPGYLQSFHLRLTTSTSTFTWTSTDFVVKRAGIL